MKKLVLVISLIIIVLSVKAQNGEYHVRIHGQESKGIILDAPVSSIDSIFVNPAANNPIKVRTINNLYSFGYDEIDSLTFPWVATGIGDIVYITYNGNSVDIVNPYPSSEVVITASEGKVSVMSTSSTNITYCLSGTSNPGRFAIESAVTPTVMLNGVSLTNPTGKAMDLTCDNGVILQIADGTDNSLSDGSDSDKKAALMCNSDLVVQGNGTLNVTSFVKHPIKVKGICTINSGNFVITSDVDDVNGLSADSTLVINGGSFDITMNGDISKCIKCDDNMTINGGEFTLVAAGSTVLEVVNNQNVPSYCTAIKCDNDININGGSLNITLPNSNHGGKYYVHSDANDGIDSNGTMFINGGFAVSNGSRAPEEGFDCDNNQFKVTGGTIVGTGGGTSTPTASVCTQPTLRINTMPGYAIQVLNASGTAICTFQCPEYVGSGGGWPGPGGGNSSMVMLFTDPQLQQGQTYTVRYNGTIGGGTEWNGYYTGNVTYTGGDTATVTLNSMYSSVNAGSSGGGW